MARWERRFQGGGIYTLLIGPGSCHQPVRKGSIGTGWWHKPVPKVFFSIPKGGKQRPLVPVGATNRDSLCATRGAVRWEVKSHLASRGGAGVVYKRCCAYHFELLSTAGFRAYSVSIMPVGLLGRRGLGSWPIAGFLVVSRPMPSG